MYVKSGHNPFFLRACSSCLVPFIWPFSLVHHPLTTAFAGALMASAASAFARLNAAQKALYKELKARAQVDGRTFSTASLVAEVLEAMPTVEKTAGTKRSSPSGNSPAKVKRQAKARGGGANIGGNAAAAAPLAQPQHPSQQESGMVCHCYTCLYALLMVVWSFQRVSDPIFSPLHPDNQFFGDDSGDEDHRDDYDEEYEAPENIFGNDSDDDDSDRGNRSMVAMQNVLSQEIDDAEEENAQAMGKIIL